MLANGRQQQPRTSRISHGVSTSSTINGRHNQPNVCASEVTSANDKRQFLRDIGGVLAHWSWPMHFDHPMLNVDLPHHPWAVHINQRSLGLTFSIRPWTAHNDHLTSNVGCPNRSWL